MPFLQNGLQNHQKSIRFIDKTHMAFHHVEKAYKTCRLLILSVPLWQNDAKKFQESIRFSVKVDGVLRLCKTSKKHWS